MFQVRLFYSVNTTQGRLIFHLNYFAIKREAFDNIKKKIPDTSRVPPSPIFLETDYKMFHNWYRQ